MLHSSSSNSKVITSLWEEPGERVGKCVVKVKEGNITRRIAQVGAKISVATMDNQNVGNTIQESEEMPEPGLGQWFMVANLITTTASMAFCTQFAVDSIDALSQKAIISKLFICLILLPILNNGLTPIQHARKDNIHHTINFTIGKCLQTALFVTLVMVVIV